MSPPMRPQMAIAILAISLIFFNVGSMASYSYYSPSPSPSPYPSSPSSLTLTFIGHVYCYPCYELDNPQNSPHKIHSLKGAMVEAMCKVGDRQKVIKEYGETNRKGEYNITLEVNLDYTSNLSCEAKLYAPPKHSPCNITTKMNEEIDYEFEVEQKGLFEFVLKAKPFAYCKRHCLLPPIPYSSPPPPSPPVTTSPNYH